MTKIYRGTQRQALGGVRKGLSFAYSRATSSPFRSKKRWTIKRRRGESPGNFAERVSSKMGPDDTVEYQETMALACRECAPFMAGDDVQTAKIGSWAVCDNCDHFKANPFPKPNPFKWREEYLLSARDAGAEWVMAMPARDFLWLTTTDDHQYPSMEDVRQEAKPLDVYNQARTGPMFLKVNLKGKVYGHEGRHRAAAVMNEEGPRAKVVVAIKYDGEGYDGEQRWPSRWYPEFRGYGSIDMSKNSTANIKEALETVRRRDARKNPSQNPFPLDYDEAEIVSEHTAYGLYLEIFEYEDEFGFILSDDDGEIVEGVGFPNYRKALSAGRYEAKREKG